MFIFLYISVLLTVRLLKLEHLEEDYPIEMFFLKTKDSQVLCKQTNNINKF